MYFYFNISYDWVEIHNGDDVDFSMIGKKLCGSKKPNPIFSSGNKILIRFHSDGDDDERVGFKLRVEEKGDECLLPYCSFKIPNELYSLRKKFAL